METDVIDINSLQRTMHEDDQDNLSLTIHQSPHTFLEPTKQLHDDAIAAIKDILDPLAKDINQLQHARRDENRRKRKRAQVDAEETVLQIRQIYTTNLGVQQVWEQARRVLDASCSEVERELTSKVGIFSHSVPGINSDHSSLGDAAELSTDSALELEEGDENDAQSSHGEDDRSMSEGENGVLEEMDDPDFEMMVDDDMDSGDPDDGNENEDANEVYVQDPNGLNDGFFSIDDFNRQSQFREQQDARGEDDNPSDEDEIDWDADPLSMPLSKSKYMENAEKDLGEDLEDQERDDDGPTFGNADLNADDSDDLEDEGAEGIEDNIPGLDNTNDILYAEFFQPPPKKQSQKTLNRALPKTQPPQNTLANAKDDVEQDLERAIADVRRDLLDSDEEIAGDEDGTSDEGRVEQEKNMSTHEKQRAQIAAEIRRLEAASVAKKDWTLSGEARGADRPINSLLEEDLEFERVGKPVPVVTIEVSEEIEQLIKRRVLAREFDEVVRRRPDAIGFAAETRRGRVEVDDKKSQAGLAEIYEQDHLRRSDPGFVDKTSAATTKQHEEINRLWKEVSSQLDMLTNLHFKPKRVDIQMKTVEDKPVISMEDARPVGAGGDESMLAPQEVYRPGEGGKAKGEVVGKGGANISKDEMTREQKLRKRRREKERLKKANGNVVNGSTQNGINGKQKSRTEEKQDILSDLKKGNVKLIGKRGELQDIGKQKQTGAESKSSSAYKL